MVYSGFLAKSRPGIVRGLAAYRRRKCRGIISDDVRRGIQPVTSYRRLSAYSPTVERGATFNYGNTPPTRPHCSLRPVHFFLFFLSEAPRRGHLVFSAVQFERRTLGANAFAPLEYREFFTGVRTRSASKKRMARHCRLGAGFPFSIRPQRTPECA